MTPHPDTDPTAPDVTSSGATPPGSPTSAGRIVRLAEPTGSTASHRAGTGGQGPGAAESPAPPPFLGTPANARGAWLLAPMLLFGIVAGAVFVSRAEINLFGWAFGLLLFAGVAWVVVSVFFPPKTDRQCPECGEVALRRLDRDSTHGVRCARCDYVDENRSAFLMAEEEGPFESAVLEDRKRQPHPSR